MTIQPDKPSPKLLDQMRDVLRTQHYSIRTENVYVEWARRFILFHHKRHPRDMGTPEIEAFLTHLALERKVSASTQNQALSAILFLYRQVLHVDVAPVDAVRARKPQRLPTVLSRGEVICVINAIPRPPTSQSLNRQSLNRHDLTDRLLSRIVCCRVSDGFS